MKKIYLFIFLACCSSAIFSQTLFTYGNTAVDKGEFIRAYNKNKTPVNDKEKALREFCVSKYSSPFDKLKSSQQGKVRKQYPVLFQDL